ncbi:MAG: twin-arginine translocase subunit TatC [Gemmatimonadota bacterium]
MGARNPRGEMPFLDHLEELRWRIFKGLIAVGVGAVVGFVLVMQFGVLDLLLRPLREVVSDLAQADIALLGGTAVTRQLTFLSLTEPFFFMLKLGLLVGLVLASPIVVWQIWAFLSPALEKHERRVVIPSLYLGLVLFAAGVAMAYFVALPVTIRFLLTFGAEYFTPMLTAGYYLSFVNRLLFAFGLIFELPVVVMILAALGLATPAFLREKRRHAIVIITVVAAILSPGDIVLLTLLMMVPLILLYELSILLATLVYRKREKRIMPSTGPAEGAVEMEG